VRVAAKETAAALAALWGYAITVLPLTRRELRRWRRLAEAVPDPDRRRQALSSLAEKRGNVEAVAVFATLAPLRKRAAVLRAIVPLQLGIDYRDVLEEAGEDGGHDTYLTALEAGWVREVECLAGCSAIAPTLQRAAERCAAGQRQTHAAAAGDGGDLQRWAERLESPPGYRWWELAAGASSSVAAHALIAAAASPDGLAAALPAFRRAPDWPHAVHDTQEAMFRWGAEEPEYARMGGKEMYAAGKRALDQREVVTEGMEELLGPGYELKPDTPPIASEAIGGALYSLLYDHVNKKGPETLPELVPTLVYATLAPFLEAEEAYEVAIS